MAAICFLIIMYYALIVAMYSFWLCIIFTHFTELNLCEFLAFHGGAVVSVLVGYGAASLGKWCPTFQDNILVSECQAPITQLCGTTFHKDRDLTLFFVDESCAHVCHVHVCLSLNRYPYYMYSQTVHVICKFC